MIKELLAPAGDIESGYAALHYGADAVYLGLKQFSARDTATNFSPEELNEFVGFAHSKGKKVFVAINTIVKENELLELLKTLEICSTCKVDAVILQDIGAARIVRDKFPELAMHASTQMAVHNVEGAVALRDMGFERVVLARELTLSEIKDIAKIPDLELEVFIHGALCYSYSGLCLFSAMTTGRSANRGKCVYPCRSVFEVNGASSHCFSMKDLALEEDVLKLPVLSLKIEGRKKNALYVASVVDYYRNLLDDKKQDETKADNIKQVFSRPWSKFNLNGKDRTVVDADFVGHRGVQIGKVEQLIRGNLIFHTQKTIERRDGIQIEVPGVEKPFGFSLQQMMVNGVAVFRANAKDEVRIKLPSQAPKFEKGQKIYLASSSEVKNSYGYDKPKVGEFRQKAGVLVRVEVLSDRIIASSGNCSAQVLGEYVAAKSVEMVEQSVRSVFAKTGDCDFELAGLEVANVGALFAPLSHLNELRRKLYEQLRPEKSFYELPEIDTPCNDTKGKKLLFVDNLQYLDGFDWESVEEVVFLLSVDTDIELLKKMPKSKIRIALPVICRSVRRIRPVIDALLGHGYKKWEIGNYWGLAVLPKNGIDLSFDNSIYTINSQALQMAKEMGATRVTIAFEDELDNVRELLRLSPLPLVVPVRDVVPLFRSAVCIRENSCVGCDREEKRITLKQGEDVYQAVSKNCHLTLFSQKDWHSKTVLPSAYYRYGFVYRKYRTADIKIDG